MRKSMLVVIAMVLMMSSGVFAADTTSKPGAAAPGSATASVPTAEEKAILETAEAFTSAFNKGDAKAVAALWIEQGEYVDEAGREMKGRDAIEKEYAGLFRTHPGVQIELSVSSVRMLTPSVAMEEGTTVVKSPKGRLASRGYYTAVHVKQDGKWLLASVRDQASPPSSARPKLNDLEWLIGDWSAGQDSTRAEFTFKWIAEKKFMEMTYNMRNNKGNPRSGVQIIGLDPASEEIVSWSFFPNGGCGQSRWTPFGKGWIIDSAGIMPDGKRTASTYMISRPDENSLSWKSVNRAIAGKKLKDTDLVVLKRKTR